MHVRQSNRARGQRGPTVRQFHDNDYERSVEIWNRARPDLRRTVEEARYEESVWDYDRYVRLRFTAEDRGNVVGYGQLNHVPDEFHPDKYRIEVVVDPAHRRRGVGTALYERLLRELRARGAIAVRAGVHSETAVDAVTFLTRRGFTEVQRGWQLRLDVAGADLARFAGAEQRAAGISITTLEAEGGRDPDALRHAYELSLACEQDIPAADVVTPTSYEHFLAYALRSPNALPEAFFLAVDAGRYVGVSALYRSLGMPEVLNQGLTGVLRDYRGRGIATALKVQTVRYAQERGYREIRTWNDERNGPMMHINTALGFVRAPAWVMFEKALVLPGESVGGGAKRGDAV